MLFGVSPVLSLVCKMRACAIRHMPGQILSALWVVRFECHSCAVSCTSSVVKCMSFSPAAECTSQCVVGGMPSDADGCVSSGHKVCALNSVLSGCVLGSVACTLGAVMCASGAVVCNRVPRAIGCQ